ncbi:hypothetical protein SETIT_4G097800v2 [Setaria italica]|uniref:Uncharacterized protein n=1 Tax=Setaria italica TaxID=4555 RepID=A0A368QSU4_SETIT|nr:hypothetical protein SETIT_4G097800v2 [Setaria italica]
MLGNWLTIIDKKKRRLIFVGVVALMWAIWDTCNDMIFEKKRFTSFMQTVLRGAYWLRYWSVLQRKDTRETIRMASKALKVIALDIFAKNGWRSNNKLCL